MAKGTSFRLSDKARELLAQQAEELSISMTDVLELLIRAGIDISSTQITIEKLMELLEADKDD